MTKPKLPEGLPTADSLRQCPAGMSRGQHRDEVLHASRSLQAAVDNIERSARFEGRDLLASEQRTVDALLEEHRALCKIEDDILDEATRAGIPGSEMYMTDEQRAAATARSRELMGITRPDGRSSDRNAWHRDGEPLPEDRSMLEWVSHRSSDLGLPSDHRELSLRKYLRGMVTGDWSDADAERRAMSEGTQAAGGYAVPTVLAAQIIDLARPKTRVLQAGARIVPMSTKKVDVAKWVGDPTPGWHSEHAVIAASDGTLGSVSLEAKTLTGLTKASRELLEDAQGVEQELMEAFAAQFALSVDYAALYGSGTAPEPRGVRNTTGITIDASLGANGAVPTDYDFLVNAVGALQDEDEEPNAAIMAPRTQRTLALFKDTTNQPLRQPAMLDSLTRYSTTQVPTDLTAGTSSDTSDVFVGDWSKVMIGLRTQLTIRVLTERYADTGELAFASWWRGDVAVGRPKAFTVVTGVRA